MDFVVIVEAQTFFCGRLYQTGKSEGTNGAEGSGADKNKKGTSQVPSRMLVLKAVLNMNGVKYVPSLAVSSFLELQWVTVS